MALKFDVQNRRVLASLDKALAANPEAKAILDKLPESHRNEYLKWIGEAKKETTMQRRLQKLIPMLLAKKSTKAA
jgi:uncharacterized protein YdeI (YjbR/CyaY-like superfamily)